MSSVSAWKRALRSSAASSAPIAGLAASTTAAPAGMPSAGTAAAPSKTAVTCLSRRPKNAKRRASTPSS
ncbi:hypothetical protein L6R52_08210 [Myxococcota bacterium]|nr:hypothetical protein [Myxococcota bacterium]